MIYIGGQSRFFHQCGGSLLCSEKYLGEIQSSAFSLQQRASNGQRRHLLCVVNPLLAPQAVSDGHYQLGGGIVSSIWKLKENHGFVTCWFRFCA